jgi:putative acyl-CoA dehydrogenase
MRDPHQVFQPDATAAGLQRVRLRRGAEGRRRARGGGWALGQLSEYGARTAAPKSYGWGFEANAFPAALLSHDRNGRRDRSRGVPRELSPADVDGADGGHSFDAVGAPRPAPTPVRAALVYLQAQVDAGHGCPLTMTFAAVPTLELAPSLAAVWRPKILASAYDPRNVPHSQKTALTIGWE